MDADPADWKSASTLLNLASLAACGVAAFTTGGLAFLAVAVAVACLAGSFAASLAQTDSHCEPSSCLCDEAAAGPTEDDPTIGQAAQPEFSQRWRQTIATSRTIARCR